MWVKFLSRHSEEINIYTKYLSCLVYSQVHSMFVCTLWPCLSSFPQSPQAQRATSLVEVLLRESRLRYVTWHTRRPVTSGLFLSCEKNSISNVHFVGMPLEWAGNLKFSYFAVLTIADLWSPNVPNSIHYRYVNTVTCSCLLFVLFPIFVLISITLRNTLMRCAILLQYPIIQSTSKSVPVQSDLTLAASIWIARL